jgi:Skp family chaperone for outer membrane proteins
LKTLIFFTFFYFILSTGNAFSNNIGTINLDLIYKKSLIYINFVKDLDVYKNELEKNLKLSENEIIIQKEKIEDFKLIANKDEIDSLTLEYNKSVEILMSRVEIINKNISKNIETNRTIIKKEIIEISQQIAEKNSIDIIFSNNQYFISSKNIDITENVISILNKKNLSLNLDKLK